MAPIFPQVASSSGSSIILSPQKAREHKEGPPGELCGLPPTPTLLLCNPNRLPGNEAYTLYCALLIVFESDDLGGCLSEAESMGKELEEDWGFRVEIYQIPFISQDRLQKEVEKAVSAFIQKFDGGSNLLWVHYGGHGFVNREGKFMIAMPKKGTWYKILLAPIRERFLRCAADVAIIIDACQAAASSYRLHDSHTVEILAACAEERRTPEVGPNSFTSALVRALRNCKQDTLTLRELREILGNAPSLENEPVRVALRKSIWGSITLRRSRSYRPSPCFSGLITRCQVLQQVSNLRNYLGRSQQLVKWTGEAMAEEAEDAGFVVISWACSKI